jgi:hypothetical protein
VLLVQKEGDLSVLTVVIPLLLHHTARVTWTHCGVVITGYRKTAVLPAVTAVLLHNCAMGT